MVENVCLTGAGPAFGLAVQGGNEDVTSGNAVATDAAGNVYVAGTFEDTLTLGSGADTLTLTGNGSSDGFVAKYSAGGALIWAQALGGAGLVPGPGHRRGLQRQRRCGGFL